MNNQVSSNGKHALELNNINCYYDTFRAVKDVSLKLEKQKITAFIGPSGCGKSTVLRTINRMNDLIPGARIEGEVFFHGQKFI